MFGAKLDDAINVDDLRVRARHRLPRAVFDAVDGGAGAESTLRANEAAFARLDIRPRALADVTQRDMSTAAVGTPMALPVMLAPCGFARMCDGQAELAAARAAGRVGTVFVVSAAASMPLEQIAEVATGPLWYQHYLTGDRPATAVLLRRVAAIGCSALVVTIDQALSPSRERDIRNRLTVPLEPSLKLLLTGLSRPRWARDFLLGDAGLSAAGALGLQGARVAYWNLARTVTDVAGTTWDDIRWIRDQWPGPLLLKGVLRGDEVPEMVRIGVDGVIVSNHGGRNLDGVRATIDALPEVVAAADGEIDVLIDGGVRRGIDVLRALALGAKACLVGRPYMFALAAGGEAGVDRMFEILRADVERALAFAGCASIQDVDSTLVAVRPDPWVAPTR